MSGVFRSRVGPLSLWVLIATIFIHALLPTGSALARTMGSAFSASTVDVSLAPSRKAIAAARQAQAPDGEEGANAGASDIVLLPTRPAAFGRPAGQGIRLTPSGTRIPAVPASSVQARDPPSA